MHGLHPSGPSLQLIQHDQKKRLVGQPTETLPLDEGEEEESEVTQEVRAGIGGGEKEKVEKRGRDADEEKIEETAERGGEKREGDAPQGSSAVSFFDTWCRTRYGSSRSLLRRTRARGGGAQAPEGRRRRKTD